MGLTRFCEGYLIGLCNDFGLWRPDPELTPKQVLVHGVPRVPLSSFPYPEAILILLLGAFHAIKP